MRLFIPLLFLFPTQGLIPKLSCSSESVQEANSAHLRTILSELADSTFFRLVRVDGHGYCPIGSIREKLKAENGSTCGAPSESFGAPFSGFGAAIPGSSSPSLCSIEPEVTAHEVAETIITSISPEEAHAQSEFPRDNECVIEGTFQIRPDYWLDMCDKTLSGSSEYVNLVLNPERNTGYDGSAVWKKMHAAVDGLSQWEEGRILSRIISGYHTSVTTQIMANYFPSKSGSWLPNTKKFSANVRLEWIEDMEFAFVVMARSLFKIKEYLYDYSYSTGNQEADQKTASLMRHLLDSSVLSSCGAVVVAGFDESVMFNGQEDKSKAATEFKRAVRKISKMVNCVTCHRCKLHATISLRGIGVGLKILLTDPALVTKSITRDDIVALVNTVYKLSESLELGRELVDAHTSTSTLRPTTYTTRGNSVDFEMRSLDFINQIRSQLTRTEEDALVHAIVSGDEKIMTLAKIFSEWTFVRHSLIALNLVIPDAVIVGGGLAGLVTAVSLADRGGSVVVMEKQGSLGGNSAKASSGINSVRSGKEDDLSLFLQDTVRSQNGYGDSELAKILVERANQSVSWLEAITGVNLTSVGQLGGHSAARTWKPEHGVVGAELMTALIRVVKQRWPQIQVVTHAKVVAMHDNSVEYETANGERVSVKARSVVLASGGFGFDNDGMLRSYRPDLAGFPTTLGSHTTGDGIKLAAQLGASLVDMEYVQLHPTGFVDPTDPGAHSKVLAAEVLRGAGGVLVDGNGKRFVNELGTRKHITDIMVGDYAEGNRIFQLILSETAVRNVGKLAEIYLARGLVTRIESMSDMSLVIHPDIAETLRRYSEDVTDEFGRSDRQGLPVDKSQFWYVGKVTPVVHYTMGGIRVDHDGHVLTKTGAKIEGLYAVGEVSGGIHGENRLGGNSLLECTVFGRIIGGQAIPVHAHLSPSNFPRDVTEQHKREEEVKEVTMDDLRGHASESDCWTVISGKVYNLSNYAEEHPGGAGAIRASCGVDSTNRFLVAHSPGLLDDIEFRPIASIRT